MSVSAHAVFLAPTGRRWRRLKGAALLVLIVVAMIGGWAGGGVVTLDADTPLPPATIGRLARHFAVDHRGRPGAVAGTVKVEPRVRLARAGHIVALGTFGYDWTPGRPGTSLHWADAQAIAQTEGVPPRWDTASQAPWFDYTDDRGRRHTVCFEDSRSLAGKLDVVRRYNDAGVAIRRLGGEDPAIWTVPRPAS